MTPRQGRAGDVLAFLAGSVPTLAHMVSGGWFLLDDFENLNRAARDGFTGFGKVFGWRPVHGMVQAVTYGGFGDNPVPYFLVMALLGGVTGLLVWRLAQVIFPSGMSVAVAAAWALQPNRSSMRFWIPTLPLAVAMVMVLLAGLAVATGRIRTGRGRLGLGLLLVGAVLAYEPVLVLAIPIAVWSGWESGRSVRAGLAFAARKAWLPLAVLAVISVRILLKDVTPDRGYTRPFAGVGTALQIHILGLLPDPLHLVGAGVFLGGVVWAAVRFVGGSRDRVVISALLGAAIAVAGLAPFVAGGYNLQSYGVLDRGNLIADLGSAVVFAAVGYAIWERTRFRMIAGAAMAAVLAWSAVGVVAPIGDYLRASDDARLAVVALTTLDPAEGEVYVERAPIYRGVAWVYYEERLWHAYQFATGDPVWPAGWLHQLESGGSAPPDTRVVNLLE